MGRRMNKRIKVNDQKKMNKKWDARDAKKGSNNIHTYGLLQITREKKTHTPTQKELKEKYSTIANKGSIWKTVRVWYTPLKSVHWILWFSFLACFMLNRDGTLETTANSSYRSTFRLQFFFSHFGGRCVCASSTLSWIFHGALHLCSANRFDKTHISKCKHSFMWKICNALFPFLF